MYVTARPRPDPLVRSAGLVLATPFAARTLTRPVLDRKGAHRNGF
jgi:hypothetical protein